MKLNSKQIFEFVGVLAVVISLVFVILELRQGNMIAQASAEAQLRDLASQSNLAAMENSELSEAIAKLRTTSASELTSVQFEMVRNFYMHQMITMSLAEQYRERGLLSEYSYSVFQNLPRSVMKDRPGAIAIYSELINYYGFTEGINPMWDSLIEAVNQSHQ